MDCHDSANAESRNDAVGSFKAVILWIASLLTMFVFCNDKKQTATTSAKSRKDAMANHSFTNLAKTNQTFANQNNSRDKSATFSML